MITWIEQLIGIIVVVGGAFLIGLTLGDLLHD